MTRLSRQLRWAAAIALIAFSLVVAIQSPLLQWRAPIYIAASFAGIIGMSFLLLQPLLITGVLPARSVRRAHITVGAGLLLAVFIHVFGLWITSPPDVVDVLLFRSPTPFAAWGVLAMWATIAAALLAIYQRRLGYRLWRISHTAMVAVVVIGTVVHAWQIDGTMGDTSKAMLCGLVLFASAYAIMKRRAWRVLSRR